MKKILSFIILIIALFVMANFGRVASAATIPKLLTNIITDIDSQTSADKNSNRVGSDYSWMKFNINFKINESISNGDYFYVYQKGILNLGENSQIKNANNKVVGKIEVVERNNHRSFYWTEPQTPEEVAKFNSYTVDETIPWAKYKITFNENAKELIDGSFKLNYVNKSNSVPIFNKNTPFQAIYKVNENVVFSKDLIIGGWSPRSSNWMDLITSGSNPYNFNNKKGVMGFSLEAAENYTGVKIEIELDENTPIKLLPQKIEKRTSGNFVFSKDTPVSSNGIVAYGSSNSMNISQENDGDKKLIVSVLSHSNNRFSFGILSDFVLDPEKLVGNQNVDIKNNIIRNVKYKYRIIRKDGSIIKDGVNVANISFTGTGSIADLIPKPKPQPLIPATEEDSSPKDDKFKESEPIENIAAPNTGIKKSFNILTIIGSGVATLILTALIYRENK